MTQNPYAQMGYGGDLLEPMNRRTSVLAIVALVVSLLCFVPFIGVIAMILGGAAIVLISRSNGRLGGLGLAISGCVIGMLTSILWAAVGLGASNVASLANQHFMAPVGKVFTGVDTQNYADARSMFSPRANAVITDAEIATFSAAIKKQMGAYKGAPEGMIKLISAYSTLGKTMQNFQGRNDIIPFPGNFEKGQALIALSVDQRGNVRITPGQKTMETVPLMNLAVINASGDEIWLVDPDVMRKRLADADPSGGKDTSSDADDSEEPDESLSKKGAAPTAPDAPNPPSAPKKP